MPENRANLRRFKLPIYGETWQVHTWEDWWGDRDDPRTRISTRISLLTPDGRPVFTTYGPVVREGDYEALHREERAKRPKPPKKYMKKKPLKEDTVQFRFIVDVEVERDQGKFASRDELADLIREALAGADLGQLDCENGGTYSVSQWEIGDA